jgi:aspartate racemase
MKTLGILGGMGPEATSLFYQKVIENTPAKCDQDHVPVVMINRTNLPDRGPYILSGNLEPLGKEIQVIGKKLADAGADFIVMPCNTVHAFSEFLSILSIPTIDMIQETTRFLKQLNISKIGVLATNATIKTQLYQRQLQAHNIYPELPNTHNQKQLMEIIYNIKKGYCKIEEQKKLERIIIEMKNQGITDFILGCTELPLISNYITYVNLIDPMNVLASCAVNYALGKIKLPYPKMVTT